MTTATDAPPTRRPEPIRSVQLSPAEAFEKAKEDLEPLLIPASIFADDRGWSVMNLMQGVLGPAGQINYSVMYPSVIKAWHRHDKQTDFWLCINGHVKTGVYRESDGRRWMAIVGERRPGVVIIPPPLWHGCATVGHEPAGLLYYVTHQYDPGQPDEHRMGYDGVDGFPWGVQHG
ncbi:MAG: hypothetical protein AAFX79_10135 [Planctomycetota bacterium]